MIIRYFALIYGIVFLVVGIAGFVPGLKTPLMPEHGLAVESGAGYLFGLFPVNILHNLVHILFGVWGLVAYRTIANSRIYARSVAIIYAVLAIMGLIPVLNTTFGLIPLFGHDIWLHVLLAAVAAYFGFVAKPGTVETTESSTVHSRR
jgi:hypothetical protein